MDAHPRQDGAFAHPVHVYKFASSIYQHDLTSVGALSNRRHGPAND